MTASGPFWVCQDFTGSGKVLALKEDAMAGRIQRQLWEVALDQDGYVTTDDAHRLGINVVELGKLAHRGQLERIGYGIYRFPQLPPTQYAPYLLAVLWTGSRGALSHATAIELYELAEINPNRIHVTVPPGYRPRRQGGELYAVHHQQLDAADVGRFEGIPIVKPAVAIHQVIDDGTPSHLVRQAIETARNRGQVTSAEHDALDTKLQERE